MTEKTRSDSVTLPGGDALVNTIHKDDTHPDSIGPVTAQGPFLHERASGSIISHEGTNGRFRPCHHVQYTSSQKLWQDEEYLHSPDVSIMRCRPNWLANTASPLDADALFATLVSNGAPGVTPLEWRALDSRALAFMLPSMRPAVSLVNFLLELKDFKYLFRGERGARLSRAKKFIARLRGKDGNKPFRELSQLVLFKEFALDPFIGDIISVYEGLTSIKRRLRDLELRAHSLQSRKFKAPLSELSDIPDDESVNSGPIIWNSHENSVQFDTSYEWLISPVYNATCRYVYALDDSQGWYVRQTDALLDTLGLRSDVSIFWNATPFTFIVDWFVNVSRFLEQFSVNNIGMRIEVLDFCSSIKSSLHGRVTAKHHDSLLGVIQSGNPSVMFDGVMTHYDRRTNVPNLKEAMTTSGLNLREAFLSAALVGANIPRGKRR